MKIKLQEMKIRNFKGFKDYTFKPKGKDTDVFGDNGTGKTTLYDAFLWCLFGKNSVDQSDTKFDWKPLDSEGNEVHNLETEVILKISIDGEEREFSRNITEKWTKKRGSVEQLFDGHTTTYYIDGLKVKQKEYKEQIESLIKEENFKMLTNLNYFPEVMNWKDRRIMLLEMAGNISDEDVIKENSKLSPLLDLDQKLSIEDHLKLTRQNKKQINQQVNALPGRIDEVERSLPDISKLDKKAIEKEKAKIIDNIEKVNDEKQMIKNGFSDIQIKAELSELKGVYRDLDVKYSESIEEDLIDLKNVIEVKKEKLTNLEDLQRLREKDQLERELKISSLKSDLAIKSESKENLMQMFYEVRDETIPSFEEHSEICPTCGQLLPEDKIQELQKNYEEKVKQFNLTKANKLSEIQEKGKVVAEKIDHLNKEINSLQNSQPETDSSEKIIQLQKELSELNLQLSERKKDKVKFDETDEAKNIMRQIHDKEDELNGGQELANERLVAIDSKLKELNEMVSNKNDLLYQFDLYDKQKERMNELIEEQKKLDKEYGKLEQLEYLIEDFIKTKVDMLTDSINSHFKIVKFKLFGDAINGGLIEMCEPTVNGKNYSTGLNNAARINAGLDIINTLMKFNDVYPPVFVDNAEGINELIDIDTQLITLNVSKDQELRIGE
ncbi:AAA family ATPase [Facklamia sp. P12934]|uniref:AAA family ATPase n=1 Tax=Facklamia sp. P12934 TaxID=3421948 RepID=UPI003D164DC4